MTHDVKRIVDNNASPRRAPIIEFRYYSLTDPRELINYCVAHTASNAMVSDAPAGLSGRYSRSNGRRVPAASRRSTE